MNENPQPGQSPDFRHGYTSGVEGIDRQAYEGYLSSQVNDEWLSQRLTDKREALQRTEERITETVGRRKAAFDRLQEHLLNTNLVAQQVYQLDSELDTIRTDQESLKERRRNAASEYSLLAGLIFLAAGISFVAGDLIISHEIVAYALNIRNNTEAWMFAIGLAMVSILLKPAYDRLIEEPYVSQASPQAVRRYGWFKTALAVLSIGTLLILGWFRYEAYRTDKLKEAINKSIKNMQMSATPLDPLNPNPVADQALLQKIEQQLLRSDELNLQLVNSPWALMSFVLSGILFALAGAVCLGISLPVMQSYWFRWLQADPKLWRLKRRRRKLEKILQQAQQELSQQVTQKNILEHELETLPTTDALSQRKQQLEADIDRLYEDARLARTDSRIAAYNDGYAKGSVAREAMSEEEYNQFRSGFFTTANLAGRARASALERPLSRPGKPRPHEAIRKFLADGMGDKE